MGSNYDLSTNVNILKKLPIVWEKNDRTKYLIQYFVSTMKFPLGVSEIVSSYDYNIECKLDSLLLGNSICLNSTYPIHGNRIVSFDDDPECPFSIWDLKNKNITPITIHGLFETGNTDTLYAYTLNKNDPYIHVVVESIINNYNVKNYNLNVWCHDTKEWKIEFILSGHTDKINMVEVTQNYKLISCSKDYTIRIWDLLNRKCDSVLRHAQAVRLPVGHAEAVLYGHTSEIKYVFAISCNRIGSISNDKIIKIWNCETFECEYTLDSSSSENYYENIPTFVGVAKNDDGSDQIVTRTSDSIKIWNGNKCIHNIGHEFCEQCLQYSIIRIHQSGRIVVVFDNTIKIFNNMTGKCEMVLVGHTNEILAIAILPDGKIASSSRDKTIRIWDLSLNENIALVEYNVDDIAYDEKKSSEAILHECNIIRFDSLELDEIEAVTLSKHDPETTKTYIKQCDMIRFLKVLPDGRLIGYTTNFMIIFK
jgi:WD40 repeat protein